MFTRSIWNAHADIYNFPSLRQDLETDVAIIGGGITGLSVALELKERGFRVAVLEALKVGGGSSSHSTGNLYGTVDRNLEQLQSRYDTEMVTALFTARAAAIDRIEQWIKQYNLDCDFHRCPWYLYSDGRENDHRIVQELETARKAGIEAYEAYSDEVPIRAGKAMKVPGQAQFNPMRYMQELARAVLSDSLQIFECTAVQEVTEKKGVIRLKTPGHTVTAKHVVHATHTPKGIRFVQTLLGPYREYGIACKSKSDNHPEGIHWGYFGDGEKYSTRNYQRNGENYLLVVGRPHKVGQAGNNHVHLRALETFAREHFEVEEVAFRWGGQHYRPADLLPYIGRESGSKEVYIATGYSTDGLVYGTLAGSIIAHQIGGVKGPWEELFDPGRHQPLKAAKNFIKENANVAKQYLKGFILSDTEKELLNVAAGEGRVVELNGKKVAACRDDSGKLQLCSAICTHMACVVNWNQAEKSWDCPCHGSRFKPDGTVLEGPAFEPLPKIEQ